MANSVTMTMRMDSDLKASVETVARSHGISMTEYIERALRTSIHATCATCGRSSIAGTAIPGFSAQFDAWVKSEKIRDPDRPILLHTHELGQQRVYWAKLREMAGGTLWIEVFLDREGRRSMSYTMPRGVIIGYQRDDDGDWYDAHRQLGSGDGNAMIAQRLLDLERARQIEPLVRKRRRPRRTNKKSTT